MVEIIKGRTAGRVYKPWLADGRQNPQSTFGMATSRDITEARCKAKGNNGRVTGRRRVVQLKAEKYYELATEAIRGQNAKQRRRERRAAERIANATALRKGDV